MLPQGIILVGLRPSHHQLPACGLRICQIHVLETVADVAETLVQPSGVAAWWMCNLGTQYIKFNIIFSIQKLSFEALIELVPGLGGSFADLSGGRSP